MVQEPSALLARLTRAVAATPGDAPLALRLCTALVETLGLEGGAMTVDVAAPSRATLCATDNVAERLEDLQHVLGEGPAHDAHRTRHPVTATPEEVTDRWPMLAQALAEQLSPAHLLAVPMRPAGEVLGVITLHADHPLSDGHDLVEAQYLADAIGVAVVGAVENTESPEELWSARDRVNQAVGMVVAQLRIRPDDALAVLHAHAFAAGTTVSHVADHVLSGALDFKSGRDDEDETQGDR